MRKYKITIFDMKTKKKITLNYPKSAAMGFFPGTQVRNEFETAVVKEPSVFQLLKVYCIWLKQYKRIIICM